MAQHQEQGGNKAPAGALLHRDSLGLEGARKGTNCAAVKWGLSSPSKKKERLWKRQSLLLVGNNGGSSVPTSPVWVPQCAGVNPALSWTPACWQPAPLGKFPEF